MLEGVTNEHFENCKAPIGLITRTRHFDELWVDSSCKYATQCGILRTLSTECGWGQSQ